jgi:SPP1 gp7 family putative phage head morphogenesis protein
MAKLSPARIDPTRLFSLRRRFVGEMSRRFDALASAIRVLIIGENVFGLTDEPAFNPLSLNTRWSFDTNPEKVKKFQAWLKEQVDAGILISSNPDKPWTGEFVESAYKTAVNRTYSETHKDMGSKLGMTADEFAQEAFSSNAAVAQIKHLYERSYSGLVSVTKSMERRVSETLAQGFADGLGAREIARTLTRDVGMEKRSALRVARTELTYAYAEGQLDGFEAIGVQELGVLTEWLTTGDDRVCPTCAALNKSVYTIDEARGLIPRHPNCRCAWVPNLDPSDKQLKMLAKTKKQLSKSVGLERPRLSLEEARARSTWKGADLSPSASKGPQTLFAPAPSLFNEQPTSIIRWMQQDGWTFEEIRRVLEQRGVEVAEGTIRTQISRAKKGQEGSKLTIEQQNILRGERLKPIVVVTTTTTTTTTTSRPTTTMAPWTTPIPTTTPSLTTVAPTTTMIPWTTPRPTTTSAPVIVLKVTTTPNPDLSIIPKFDNVSKTGLIRQLAKEGYSFKEAKDFLISQGIEVADGTIKKQLGDGKRGVGNPVQLTDQQLAYLRVRKGLPPTNTLPPSLTTKPLATTTAPPKEKGSKKTKPPKHITFTGKVTGLHKSVWEVLDGKPIKDIEQARQIGRLVEGELNKRLPHLSKLADLRKQVQDIEEQQVKWSHKDADLRAEEFRLGNIARRLSATQAQKDAHKEAIDAVAAHAKTFPKSHHLTKQIEDIKAAKPSDGRKERLEIIKSLRDFGDSGVGYENRLLKGKGKDDEKAHLAVVKQLENLPKDWLADTKDSGHTSIIKTVERGYFNSTTIGLSGRFSSKDAKDVDRINAVALHELTHSMELGSRATNSGDRRTRISLGLLQSDFKRERAKSSKDPKDGMLTAIYYGRDEMGYKDNFVEHYSGKDYGDSTHHEILTMGVESVFHERHKNVTEDDEDYRHFIVGLLVGY